MPRDPSARAKGRTRAKLLTVSRPELLTNGSDRQFRSFVHGMLAFAARLEGVRSRFAAQLGLTGIQYTILISIRHLQGDGEVTVGAVADHLHLSGAFVTIETGKLLRMGLITKIQDLRFDFLSAEQFRGIAAVIDRVVACGDRAIALLDYLASAPPSLETRTARRRTTR